MALFDQNRFRALASAFMVSAVLTGCGGGGGAAPNPTFTSGTQNQAQITNLLSAGGGNDAVDIAGDTVSDIDSDMAGVQPGLAFEGFLDGLGGDDEVRLVGGGRVASIAFSDQMPTSGELHLQRYEIITLNGGTVTGNIDTSAATSAVTFNLTSGMIGGDVTGTSMADRFVIGAGITISGMIDGGAGMDTLSLATGFTPTAANLFGGVLTLTLNGGGSLALTLANIATENINVGTLTLTTMMLPAPGDGMMPVVPSRTTLMGTSGDDRPTLDSSFNSGSSNYSYDALGGNDVITITARVNGNVLGGAGMDTFTLSGEGIVGGNLEGGAEADTFMLTGVTVGGNIDGGTGNDAFTLSDTAVGGNIDGGTGTDTFILTDVTVGGNIDGGAGNDMFTLSGTAVTGYIDGGTDTDTFTANTAVNVRVTTDDTDTGGDIRLRNVENITLSGGDNTLILLEGSVLGFITGGAGNDQVTVTSGVTFSNTSAINGGSGELDRFVWGTGLTTTGVTQPNPGQFVLPGFTPVVRNFGVFVLDGGTIGRYTGNANADMLELLSGSVTGNIDSAGGNDTITLSGGTVGGNVLGEAGNDTITISGGTLTGNVDGGAGADVFNLEGGMTSGHVDGGADDDTFNLYTAFMFTGDANSFIDGGGGTSDVLNYAGAPASATDFTFAGSNGLASDADIRDDGSTTGSVSVRNIESQTSTLPTLNSIGAGAGLRDLTVRGIEVLGLSPALNLYGAMSDALMQFGAQTAQGFALADLNLATGRATSLVSKDSPYTKGRIWAHKITHSGNGKGSIGLGLTGLTARADSDYDYEMSLTQHGFDAPLATTRLGAFNLRAVSHTMTGVIETNVAEANVSGYGAGVALLWRGGGAAASKASASATRVSAHHHHGLSAHITSLAGAYEVEAHTSPLNPRTVVNEVSEGSFSAINAVVSAGVADTRKLGHSLVLRTTADLVWQTLSLDDFTETGQDGIIINFDKATRFTARIGAGLEGEHWFSDVAFVHETSSGGTLSSGLRQDYKQDDGTAIEMKFGGKLADLATGLTLKAYAGLRTSLTRSDSIDPSAHLALNWRF